MGSKFYAVRNGRSIGIYDNWDDCKGQVHGYPGCQYKSFSSLKEAEDYIGQNVPPPHPACKEQKVDGSIASQYKSFSSLKRVEVCPTERVKAPETASKKQIYGYPGSQHKMFSSSKEAEDYLPQSIEEPQTACKEQKVDGYLANQNKSFSLLKRAEGYPAQEAQGPATSSNGQDLYLLEFDGASKGNPGKAGAGAVLRYPDGSVAYTLKEGVGVATNNVAEYRALIRGLKVCLDKGIDRVHVRGDSNLVCMQIQDKWKTKNANIAELSKEAKELKAKFREFHIDHVLREFNSEADALANAAVGLPDGEWTSS